MDINIVYRLPLSLVFLVITGFFIAFALVGLWLSKKYFMAKMPYSPDRNDQVSYFLSAVGVFYGITLGLVAVGTWENYDQVDERVTQEAAVLTSLYRDVSSFPEPIRTELRTMLVHYTKYTIEEAWPLQQQGIVPKAGIAMLNDFQKELYSFQPSSPREELIMAETLSVFNEYIALRRMRIASVGTRLPPTVWLVTIVGALLSIAFFWFMKMQSYTMQAILISMVAFFIGTMIFLITMLDNPFLGVISVGPDSFILLMEQSMQTP